MGRKTGMITVEEFNAASLPFSVTGQLNGSRGTLARLGWELAAVAVRQANDGVCLGPPWLIGCAAT